MDQRNSFKKFIPVLTAALLAAGPLPCLAAAPASPEVQAVIQDIGNLGRISASRTPEVQRIRTNYEALTPEEQAAVTNYQLLLAAESTLNILQTQATEPPAPQPTQAQKPAGVPKPGAVPETQPAETREPTEATETVPVGESPSVPETAPQEVLPPSADKEAPPLWASFRADTHNNAVVDTLLPRASERGVPLWENVYGLGYPSPVILTDEWLYCVHGGYGGNGTVTRLSPGNGDIEQESTTKIRPTWNTVPPCYGGGRIYCQLNNGTIQAFDPMELEPLWHYKDACGGKSQSPITYRDGRIYAGLGSGSSGAFVCLDAETGQLLWREKTTRGQLSAGALVLGSYVLYGDESGRLTVRERDSGKEVHSVSISKSPIRSGVCYAEGQIFFTSYDGRLHYGSFDPDTGALGKLTTVDCTEYGPHSYCTPTVYDSFVYLTVGGEKEGHAICIDTVSGEITWAVPIGPEPRASLTLSIACRDRGSLYLYTGCSQGVAVIQASLDGNSATVDTLFHSDVHSGNSSCNIINDSDGTLYYVNDSSAIFAIGRDEAWLDGLGATTGEFAEEFRPDLFQYHLTVPVGTAQVTFKADARMPITLNGGKVQEPVVLQKGRGTAEFTVTDGDHSRSYTVDIAEESGNATLREIVVCHSDVPEKSLYVTPAMNPLVTDYGVYTVDADNSVNSVNIWPLPTVFDSTVQVFQMSNVRTGGYELETGEILPTLDQGGYKIPFADQSKPIVVKILVTAQTGHTMEYHLTLSKAESRIDDIGPVTPERRPWITHARSTYDFLTEAQKAQVSNYDILIAAEEALAALTPEETTP